MLALAAALLFADPAASGPHAVDDRNEGACIVFAPVKLEGPHPVILWGNGTNAPVAVYAPFLRHWASHGFIVAAARIGQAGSGRDMLGCLDALARRNVEPGGFYEGHVDLARVGASGHSQGGSGALNAGRDPRVISIAPLQPARPPEVQPHGHTLLLSGGSDMVVARAQPMIFEAAAPPAVWATLSGASHMTPAQGGGPYLAVTTAWFRWTLLRDAQAGSWFEGERCGLCRSASWTIRRK